MNKLAQIQKKPLGQVTSVKELLVNDGAKGQLAQVAASHMKPERMMRLMANAVRTTPKLAECDPMSLLGGLMTCAGLGLEPNTVLGHAYLIPFKNNRKKVTEVQLVLGYKGLIDLARRSGHITSIAAHVHYSDDELWEYEEGTEARLRHIPGPQAGDKLHAYAIAKFKDGGHAYTVLPWSKVMSIRDNSQGWKTAVRYGKTANSPWATHEDAMARKTAIRALANYLPLSVEMKDAISLDGAKPDYAGFAMDPTGPLEMQPDEDTIEGEAVEEEAPKEDPKPKQEVREPKDEPKPKAETKPAPKQKEETPAKEEPAAPEQESESVDHDRGLVDRVLTDIEAASNVDDIQAAVALWEEQITMLPQSLQDEIEKAANAAIRRAEGV